MEKTTKRIDRRWLIISGLAFGLFFNTMITLTFSFDLISILTIMMLLLTGCTCALLLARESWSYEKKLSKSRKLRLFLFGLSLMSFIFAGGDLLVFLFSPHGPNQQLLAYSADYPYLWIGTLPLVSFLGSAVSGGFFSLLERFLELREKKDL